MTYDVDRVLPTGLASRFKDGTNLLLSGPAMSGKRDLLLELLARGDQDGEGAVLVTARDPAEDVVAEYHDAVGATPAFLRAVDCVSARSGQTTAGDRVRYVSSPSDLTGVGIEFSEVARDAADADVSRLRVGFDSLSPLLMYVDLQRLFRFLHVFTSQIQSQGWLGVFSVDPESHDDQTINTISQLFDGIVDVRVTASGVREARVRGTTDKPTEWVAVE